MPEIAFTFESSGDEECEVQFSMTLRKGPAHVKKEEAEISDDEQPVQKQVVGRKELPTSGESRKPRGRKDSRGVWCRPYKKLNDCTEEDIMALDGFGQGYASLLVNKNFKSWQEVADLHGIGPGKLKDLQAHFTI